MKKQFNQTQFEYWSKSAKQDLGAALDMIKIKREIYGLFYCHLAIEKILKAYIVKSANNYPPFTHSLATLLKKSELKLSKNHLALMGVLMQFHLEGRYAENFPVPVKNKMALSIHKDTKELFKWLEARL